MKHFLLPLFLVLALATRGQVVIDTLAWQDFETVPQAPTWTFTGPVIYNSGFSSGSAAPPNSPLGIGGSRAWETTVNSGGLLLEFANQTIPSGYDSLRASFHIAAMNLVGATGGPDDLDYVLAAYSTDGGSTWVNRVRVRGAVANNSFWPYSATGVAKTYYTPATESVFQPITTGLQSTLGYSYCEIVFPGNLTQVRVRITGRSSSSTDTWLIDNVVLRGERLCAASSGSLSPTVCGSYTSPSGNHIWNTSGTYMDTIPNSIGCDSVITVNLTVNQPTGGSLTGQYCDSLRSPSGNHLWTQSGVFYDTLVNIAGCDSIILANIVVFQSSSNTLTATACDSYTAPSGAVFTSTGTYTDVIPNAAGCDSTITINLTINTLSTSITQSGITLTSSTAGATYQWVDCSNNYAAINGATSQAFTPTATGVYAVIVEQNGCVDTSNCLNVIIVGNQSAMPSGLQVYPNPSQGKVWIIKDADMDGASVRVWNCLGSLVAESNLAGNGPWMVQLPETAGIYTLEMLKTDGHRAQVKILRE